MIVISDTSVVSALIHTGQLSLLQKSYGTVLIPRAVHRELIRSHSALPSFLEVREVSNRRQVEAFESILDLGEAEAIALAKETHADLLLIDEKLGRAIARREGLRITGVLGILVEAKRSGFIRSVRDAVSQLESRAGFRVSDPVKEEAFLQAGE